MKELIYILLFVLGVYAINFIANFIWNASCKGSDSKPVHECSPDTSPIMDYESDLTDSISYSNLPFNIWFDPYDKN